MRFANLIPNIKRLISLQQNPSPRARFYLRNIHPDRSENSVDARNQGTPRSPKWSHP